MEQVEITCIALDLDGTTLNPQGRLGRRNREAIKKALDAGIQVVAASGRSLDSLPKDILEIEGIQYDDLHFKIALTGCPNDCVKVRMHDFGIMGMTLPQLEADRCVSCGACVKACKKKSVEALKSVNYRPQR